MAFYFLRDFWGLPRPRLPPHIPRPPASPAGECPGLPSAVCAVRVYHNGHIIKIPTQIIIYILRALYCP
nr:MAG TPA: hypothetical protein [Caudoviricetes sp.]